MSYFSHPYLSNSDLKHFKTQQGLAREAPENLQAIYELGTLIHSIILEPDKANKDHEQYELATKMRDTFWKDPACRMFAMADDFHREEEIYTKDVIVGPYKVDLRCKADGLRKRVGSMLEIKGLGITTEKAFKEALVNFDYDQAIAHYMLCGDLKFAMIVGISKRDPRKLFKWFVKRNDEFFAWGEEKLVQTLTQLREFSPEDVKLAA